MSLKPLESHFGPTQSLYAPYTTTSGGGGSSTINVVASTLTVSSILGGGPGQTLEFPNGFQMPVGASIQLGGGGGPDINFTANDGEITGLSTINGAAYPPPAAATAVSTLLASVFVGDAPQSLTPSSGVSTLEGKWYNVSVGISDLGFSGLSADDSITIVAGSPAGQTGLAVLDLPRLSTLRGAGAGGGAGSVGIIASGVVESFSTFLEFTAIPNTGTTASTFISTDYAGWVKQYD
jgi:hypothetical protein